MAQKEFKKLVNSPYERIPRRIKNSKKLDPVLGEYCVQNMTVAYQKYHYSEPGISPTAPRKRNGAEFTKEALDASLASFRKAKDGRRSATKAGSTYIFNWHAVTDKDLDYVENESRRHGQRTLKKWEKDHGHKQGRGDTAATGKVKAFKGESTVGGHLEMAAFMQKLRLGVARGVITFAEAELIKEAFMTGSLEETLNRIGAKEGIKSDFEAPTGGDTGFMKIQTNQDSVLVTDELRKVIDENTTDFSINREIMTPIPDSMNQAQRTIFEQQQHTNLQGWLDAMAGPRLYEDPTSPSMEKMHQEIIAAALLGKKTPKYKHNYKLRQQSKALKKNKRVKLPKSRRTATKGAKKRFTAQLRASGNQSPTNLMALINTKLQRELTDNMGQPALENVTGRFANSVRVLKVTQAKAGTSIQYTYDRDPYGVFEKDTNRDPRKLIDLTIREIAAELVMGKFTTQRL